MVGKLIKYDFMSFFRLLLPVQLIIIGIAAINRIVQIFETDTVAYNIAFRSSIVLLAIASIVALVMCIVIAIIRFYQGLYSSEGYLSQTLPVTSSQHIISKMLVSMIFMIGTVFAIFIALNVAVLGDVGIELYKAGGYLFRKLTGQIHGHAYLFLLEFLIFLLVYIAAMFLMFYFCISIGQLVNRKKILLAFGVFFGLYVLVQIIMTIIIVIGVTHEDYWAQVFETLLNWARLHWIGAIHLTMCAAIIWQAIWGFVFFTVSRVIMTKRLNLT